MFGKKKIHSRFMVGFLLLVMLLVSGSVSADNLTLTTNWTDTATYTVTAQVKDSLAGSAANLIDQELTRWVGDWGVPSWAMVDLGESRSVGGFSIVGHAPDGGRALRTFQVQYGDATADPTVNGDWTNVVSYDMDPYDQTHCQYAFGFTPVTAQRFRVHIDHPGPDIPQIQELQAWSGAAPTMSGMYGGPGAWSIVDGEKYGAAANDRTTLGGGRCWWMVDIGPDKLVDSVDLWFYAGYVEEDYVLQYGSASADPYNDVDWTNIVDVTGNTNSSVSYSFASVGAGRIRLVSTANEVGDQFGRLCEIEINGVPEPATIVLLSIGGLLLRRRRV